mmetsp:Transcript_8234/g.12728  ORF Transcript_8234/g.12728 Transcript_8234/m.12728 type:complete len:83 (+) Transcript_8234:981-1229(+)
MLTDGTSIVGTAFEGKDEVRRPCKALGAMSVLVVYSPDSFCSIAEEAVGIIVAPGGEEFTSAVMLGVLATEVADVEAEDAIV